MKYVGETSLKMLIALIKGDIATKKTKIMETGLHNDDSAGNVSVAAVNTDYLPATDANLQGTSTAPTAAKSTNTT